MRTSNSIGILVLLVILVSSVCGFSQQQPFFCGKYKIDTAALRKAKEFENNNKLNNSIQSASFVLRVYFHILYCNDGTLPGATPAQLKTEFNTLEAAYSANNICFINAGYDNIYNTKLDTNFNADTDDRTLFNQYRVPNCINVFYTNHIDGSNPSCGGGCGYGGISFSIPGTICLIAKGNIGQGQTIAHEVGHCMGLLHTFEPAFGYEDINGSNSSTAGDQVTDTPADPYCYKGNSCYSTSTNGCTYNGSCTDPNNATNFSPPYSNLMAYWWASGCYSSLAVTGGQYTRVNSYLNTNSDLINCESPSYVTLSGVNVSSGYYMQSAINTLNTSGTVQIGGNAIALLGGSTVMLEPGFDANTANGAFTLIRLSQCSGTPNFAVAQKLQPVTETVNKTSNSLIAYPNPTSSVVNLLYTLAQNESRLTLRVYDINMKPVKEVILQNLLKGKNTVQVNLSGYTSGIYPVVIQGAGFIMKVMVVLQK